MVETNEIIPTDLQERAETAAGVEHDDLGEQTEEHIQPGAVQRNGGPETEKGRVARLRREAYSTATTRLREENRGLFNVLMKEECEKRGVEWTPRLDDEGKAMETVQELLAKYPSLRDRIQAVVAE